MLDFEVCYSVRAFFVDIKNPIREARSVKFGGLRAFFGSQNEFSQWGIFSKSHRVWPVTESSIFRHVSSAVCGIVIYLVLWTFKIERWREVLGPAKSSFGWKKSSHESLRKPYIFYGRNRLFRVHIFSFSWRRAAPSSFSMFFRLKLNPSALFKILTTCIFHFLVWNARLRGFSSAVGVLSYFEKYDKGGSSGDFEWVETVFRVPKRVFTMRNIFKIASRLTDNRVKYL